ncbi:hypothetical protein BDV06DRAFT_232860 [Aspergillus oleicola]
MVLSLYMALAFVLVYHAIAFTTRYIQAPRASNKLSKEYGCEMPVVERSWDILGLIKICCSARHLYHGTVLKNVSALFSRYGDTYVSQILGQRVFVTRDARNIQHLLVTRFSDFNSADMRAHLFRPITGNSIFVQDGEGWKSARKLHVDVLSLTRQLFNMESQEAGCRAFSQILSASVRAGHAVDLQPLFAKLILDLNSLLVMGVSSDTLNPEQATEKKRLVKSLQYARQIMARNAFLGPIHHLLFKRDFYQACLHVKMFVERIIRDELAARNHQMQTGMDTQESKREGRSILQLILDRTEDVTSVRDEVVLLLVAATDSVASLLSSTFFFLARYESVFAKLRKEVADTIGTEKPTFEMLRKIPYLSHVFHEAMRLIPPVPHNARTANRDTWLPSGGGKDGKSAVLVRKGESVVFSSWGSHRSTKVFGSDAHEFRPERWQGSFKSGLGPGSLGFIPFSMGPRVCPGQQYALLQASYITIRIVQMFSRIENRDSRLWTEKIDLNLFNKNGVLVEMVPAGEGAGNQ